MKIDYCKIVEDLMPLYQDGLVSEESRAFIEWHLNNCAKCRGKYDSDGMQVDAPKNTIKTPEDEKYKSARKFLLRLRKTMLVGVVLFVLVVSAAGAGGFLYGAHYDSEKPIKAASADDFASRIVPGWERAERAGQIVNLNITRPIEGTSASVIFEKAWYTTDRTYILYTVKEPDKKFIMAAKNSLDVPPESWVANNPAMEPLPQRWGGISKDGYHQVLVFMGYKPPVPKDELTLTVSDWMTPRMQLKPGTVQKLEGKISVKLPLKDEYFAERQETVTIDKTLEWDGRALHIAKMDIGSAKTRLYGEVILKDGEILKNLYGSIGVGKQESGLNYESISPGERPNSFTFTMYADALSEWPGDVVLKLKGITFGIPETLSFPLKWSDFKGKQGEIKIPLDQQSTQRLYDGSVKLHSIVSDNIYLMIDRPKRVLFSKKPFIIMEPELWSKPDDYSSGWKVTNENGETAFIHGTSGSGIGNDELYVGFGIDDSDGFWSRSSKIDITVIKPNARLVLDEKIKLTK